VYDVDVQRGTLLVREGKGKKDRVVPLGERAGMWVAKYVHEGRPELVHGHDEGVLFLSAQGEAISLMRASQIVRGWVRAAELGKTGACHLFRHTAATLMLENGADIRLIQALLGHAKLETTSVYTQVSIHLLKEVHARTHPGAQLAPARAAGREDVASDEVGTRGELISLLAAEDEDERGELGEGDDGQEKRP
jgi:integrase/recombinase XerD